MTIFKDSTVTLVGCTRNGEEFLPQVLANIDLLRFVFKSVKTIFAENSSIDGSKYILSDYSQKHAGESTVLNLDDKISLNWPRTHRIATARNSYIDFLRATPEFASEYLIVADLDDPITSSDFISGIVFAVNEMRGNSRTIALFANSLPIYYDIWALRADGWVESDCWFNVNSLKLSGMTNDDAVTRMIKKKQIYINPQSSMIPVRSAFGGLAIYKFQHALRSKYIGLSSEGYQICEHVLFNLYLKYLIGGDMYILPSLITKAPPEHIY